MGAQITHEADAAPPLVHLAHGRLLQGGHRLADLVQALDVLIERVARGGGVVQHLPVVGTTGLIHRHGGPVDVLGLARLEHHLLPVVEGRDPPRRPEQVVGHGRIALFPAVAVLEVVVRPHVVVLEEGDELGGIPIDPVHGEDPPYPAKVPPGDVVTEGGEQ